VKPIEDLILPHDLRYAPDHEWLRAAGATARVGISDYAQDQLGDVVYVELPAPGAVLGQGEVFGTVESVKAVSELFLPVSGTVTAINPRLADAPELVNQSPYDEGWMIEIRLDAADAVNRLMDREAYLALLKG
jgi:glycine cleavage system H protein